MKLENGVVGTGVIQAKIHCEPLNRDKEWVLLFRRPTSGGPTGPYQLYRTAKCNPGGGGYSTPIIFGGLESANYKVAVAETNSEGSILFWYASSEPNSSSMASAKVIPLPHQTHGNDYLAKICRPSTDPCETDTNCTWWSQ